MLLRSTFLNCEIFENFIDVLEDNYIFRILWVGKCDSTWGHDCFDSYRIIFLFFGFQGHHFKIVGLPNAPYISMNPNGQTADGSTTYKITGYLPEVLDNLKVSYARKW